MLRNKFEKKVQSLIRREEGKIPYSILLKVIKLDQSVKIKKKLKKRLKGFLVHRYHKKIMIANSYTVSKQLGFI